MTDAAAVDHTDPQFLAHPYPVFHALRDRGPLHEHSDWGVRIAVSHEACSEILRHRQFGRIWQDAQPATAFEAFNALHRFNMLENEHDHSRLRAIAAPLFQRRHIQSLRASIKEVVEGHVRSLCDQIRRHGSVDVMEELARPLPVDVIATLLDFPRTDRHVLRTWSNQIVTMYEPTIDDAARRTAEHAAHQFRDYVSELIATRQRHPGDDLLSQLALELNGPQARLTEQELVANYILLLMAGHEASVNGIGNSIATLHAHPDQWHLLRTQLITDEAQLHTAVDELLRYDTPNQMFERTATDSSEICGHPIKQGETVTVLLGAANRDPSTFSQPDRLDLTRSRNPHLALGAGAHYCLGAPLARLEIGTTLTSLAHHLPDFRLTSTPQRRPAFAIRGFEHLHVTADNAASPSTR